MEDSNDGMSKRPKKQKWMGRVWYVYYVLTDTGRRVYVYKNPDADKQPNNNYNYNCHGNAYLNKQYVLKNQHVRTILKDEYDPVDGQKNIRPSQVDKDKVQEGDRIVYSDEYGEFHSVIVKGKDAQGNLIINEKNGLEPQGPDRPFTPSEHETDKVTVYRLKVREAQDK
jgi:hypothetical protein